MSTMVGPTRTCDEPGCEQPHKARGFCMSHYDWHRTRGLLVKIARPSAEEYAAQRISLAGNGCWTWTGCQWSNGYGAAYIKGQKLMAHRVVYELHRPAIPTGLVLDHLCRNIICVNPDHLEPVTQGENLRRGMSPPMIVVRTGVCSNGHELDDDNLYVSPKGARRCRACMKETRDKRYQREKVERGIPDFQPRGVCNEPGCERAHYGRGVCKRHYERARVAS